MTDHQGATRDHLAGLDTLRFVAAAWVALFHGARAPLDRILTGDDLPSRVGVAFNNGIFNGVAAVMLFFVISGFVIHRPNIGRDALDLPAYYARRLTRIVPPVLIAHFVCVLLGPVYAENLSTVLWSLYCEIAYYIVYPLLFLAFRRGWTTAVFVAATLVSFGLIAANWSASYYWELSTPTLFLIGLPSWILGCVLAESRAKKRAPRDVGASGWTSIWIWRALAVALTALLKMPVTHGPVHIGYPASHWLIAIFAFFWIGRELDHYLLRPAAAWGDSLGRASFSLYLVHKPVIGFFDFAGVTGAPLGGVAGAGANAWLFAWLLQALAIGAVTVVFYLLVEAPFHRLARTLGRVAASGKPGRPARA